MRRNDERRGAPPPAAGGVAHERCGLEPGDPRFEKAVQYARRLFSAKTPDHRLDDLAQEVRIALWQRGGARPYDVAREAAIDWWRHYWGRGSQRRMGQREVLFPGDAIVPSVLSPRPAPLAEQLLELEALDRTLLATLGPREAAMVRLYHAEGHTLLEIGRRFGVSDIRVRQILVRARRRLCPVLGRGDRPDRSADSRVHVRGPRARAWLVAKLAAGPVRASILYRLAAAADLCSKTTLKATAAELGVSISGRGSATTWRLGGGSA